MRFISDGVCGIINMMQQEPSETAEKVSDYVILNERSEMKNLQMIKNRDSSLRSDTIE
ncbi:MAG TPA: hypothetical protein VFD17_01575 [Clostridia bacterium]|nr:hypothetical protein [Clostridia bacterium]